MPKSQRKLNTSEINLLLKKGVDVFSLDLESLGDKPVEYLVNAAEFYGREFYVDENVLIPRIESEELINIALKFVKDKNFEKVKFADVGTGSGILGITFALELAKNNVLFEGVLSDISLSALEIAKKNLEKFVKEGFEVNILSSLVIVESDLLEALHPNSQLNIIFANLPYIPSARIDNLSSSVKDFEPKKALDGGEDGFEIINRFLESLKRYLNKDNGVAILEVDDTHNVEFIDKHNLSEFLDIKIHNDLNSKNRYWVVQLRA